MRHMLSKKAYSPIFIRLARYNCFYFKMKRTESSRESLKEKAGKKLTEMGANINLLVQAALRNDV